MDGWIVFQLNLVINLIFTDSENQKNNNLFLSSSHASGPLYLFSALSSLSSPQNLFFLICSSLPLHSLAHFLLCHLFPLVSRILFLCPSPSLSFWSVGKSKNLNNFYSGGRQNGFALVDPLICLPTGNAN